ncbi:MAG: hypothetical protein NT105_16005 [Verrucomicrobia bacterium]|nr:hypothetical protein [Verrucomicrobiota bacterium]
MKNLHYFLENPFDDPGISLAELAAFTTDHIQRMISNNATGDFTDRITATQSALGLVDTKAVGDLTQLGVREGSKQAKNEYRKALPAGVAKIAGVVIGQYGDSAPQLLECFPQGRNVFNKCRDDEVTEHLQALLDAVTTHQADLGAPTVLKAQALLDGWTAVYGASEAASGVKSAAQEGKNLARENLQLMLFLNLLKIAEVYARQPEKLDVYMQQSLLQNHTQRPQAATPAPQPPAPPPGA